jgi:allophanate hydrolase subunit 1
MTTGVSAIIERHPAAAGRPSVTYRYAGDRSILIDYGEMDFDLTLNFAVLAVDEAIRHNPVDGLVETAPGFRTILVRYEPLVLPTRDLIEHLHALHDHLPPIREMTIPSRVIHLPIAFDDEETKRAVQRYINTIRADAPNCEGGNNIDYIVKYNGLEGREQLYEALLSTEQWAAFMGFFPGLPFMFPLDPRDTVFVPKYNPTRTWTQEGAVGVGGPCWAIYPVESAGGYQLVGRTIPIYDLQRRNDDLTPLIFRAGDRAKFYRVEEDELLQLFEDVRANRFRYQVEDRPFEVGAYLDWTEEIKDEAEERQRIREEAAAVTPVP